MLCRTCGYRIKIDRKICCGYMINTGMKRDCPKENCTKYIRSPSKSAEYFRRSFIEKGKTQ